MKTKKFEDFVVAKTECFVLVLVLVFVFVFVLESKALLGSLSSIDGNDNENIT